MRARTRRLYLAIACLLPACAGPTVFLRRSATPLSWPPGREQARIEFVVAYRGANDVETHPGFWSTVTSFLADRAHPELVTPTGLALQAPDTLWVADPGCSALHRIDLVSGAHDAFAGSAAEPLVTPVGVALDGRGHVFVSDSTRARIVVFGTDGAVQRAFGDAATLGRPTGLAWDAKGQRLLVVDTTGCRLLALDGDGTPTQTCGERGVGPGQFNFPTNLTVDARGEVFVVDSMNFRVQHLDVGLRPVGSFGGVGRGPGDFASPKGIAVDSEDHVYVVDAMFENVQIFTADGHLLLAFGGHGNNLGALQLPAGICIDARDRIVVGDGGNSRVQIFQYLRRAP